MLASKRQELILNRLSQWGQITVADISSELGVSSETIRRDINLLSAKNLLSKVHGGAIALKGNRLEPSYDERSEQNIDEKRAIGIYASGFVRDNQVIGIDTGATLDWFCRALPMLKNLSIVTSSISALEILMERSAKGEIAPQIIFLGGQVNCSNRYTQGPMAVEMLEKLSLDACFIAATAISPTGIKMYDLWDGAMTGALMEKSACTYYLGDSSKAGHEALYKVCGLEKLSHYITDEKRPIPESLSKALESAGVRCHIVSAG